MFGIRIQSTDEEHAIEIRAQFEQLPLDVADGLLAHQQHAPGDRGLIEEGRTTRDVSDRLAEERALAELLPCVEQRDPAPVSDESCDGRWSVAGGRPYARVAQSYESVRQYLDVVVGATVRIAGNGRIRAVGPVAFAYGANPFGRSEPPRGQALIQASISSSDQPTARAPIRRGRGNLPAFIRTYTVDRESPVRCSTAGKRNRRVAMGRLLPSQ